MFKHVFSLTLAVGLASAATISTTATCDGVTTFGTASATCNDGHFSATATDSSTHLSLSALPVDPTGSGGASASFSADYVFTVFPFVPGVSGGGLFFPCFSSSGENATGEASFGGITIPLGFPNCPPGLAGFSPFPFGTFTFGVPQIVHFSIEADVTGSAASHLLGGADFSFNGIQLFNPCGPPSGCGPEDLQLVPYPYTLVEVPEPAAWSLLSIGWLFFVVVRRIFA